MSAIKIENLTFAYPGGDNLFENLTLTLDTDWRLGLVGRNGRGKTTLLRLLMGEYEHTGSIACRQSMDCFPYDVADEGADTLNVLRAACPEAEDWELERELGLLGLGGDALTRPFESLSNGERTKTLLAALFLRPERFHLVDEPTNHLDAEARVQVSRYLSRRRGFILVSHDRRFLDGCVDHILAVNRSGLELRAGNFSEWFEAFERRQASEGAQNERLKRDIARLKGSARRASDWSDRVEASKKGALDKGYVGHKAAKMMKRSKAIEARFERAVEQKSALMKDTEDVEALRFEPMEYRSETLARFDGVSVAYGSRRVCGPVSFEIRRGERLALCGGNGSGKSSLVRLLLGENVPHSGTVETGGGLIMSYVPQDATHLRGSLAEYAGTYGIDESFYKSMLCKLGFARAELALDMSELSAGQRKKALLARSLCESAHIYVWDEPLNYIDLYTRMQLEALIADCRPTMLFVEHDAAFCDAAATERIEL